jgi:hypothetical protein
LCLSTHISTEYWQNRQFTTEHLGEKTLGVTAAKRRTASASFLRRIMARRDGIPISGGLWAEV